MSTFVVRLTHTSDQCPTANGKIRAAVDKAAAEIPNIASKLGVKIITGPLVLGAEHEALAIVESNDAQAVNDFLLQSGLVQWNSVRVSIATPMAKALEEARALPPIY